MLAVAGESGRFDLRVDLPPFDAFCGARPNLSQLDRVDHVDIWFDGVGLAVMRDRDAQVHVMDLSTGLPSSVVPVRVVGDALYLRPDPALGRRLTVAFSDSDGRQQLGVVATAPLVNGSPVVLGRVYDPESRWTTPDWATPPPPLRPGGYDLGPPD
ncbi:MAG: hypothetical protein H0V89_07590 [Deltaproteobacteria bacterium]|nr:hypothetical protein [Deltaproteobacteria bacterium]